MGAGRVGLQIQVKCIIDYSVGGVYNPFQWVSISILPYFLFQIATNFLVDIQEQAVLDHSYSGKIIWVNGIQILETLLQTQLGLPSQF